MQKTPVNSSISVNNKTSNFTISGWSLIKGNNENNYKNSSSALFAGSLTGRNHVGVKFYYVVRILEKVIESGVWEESVLYENRENARCSNCGVYAGLLVKKHPYQGLKGIFLYALRCFFIHGTCCCAGVAEPDQHFTSV